MLSPILMAIEIPADASKTIGSIQDFAVKVKRAITMQITIAIISVISFFVEFLSPVCLTTDPPYSILSYFASRTSLMLATTLFARSE